ncbi:MAG: ADP-ribosylation factor-like protein [Candidatus Hodarchaeota archaeon]
MGIFDFIKKKTNQKVVFVGLDNAGKSTIISFLQDGRFVEHTPTMGKKKLEFDVSGTRFSLLDMGGQEDFRTLWMGETKSAKCVVFVIDKSDTGRFAEAKKELEKLIPTLHGGSIPLLILANKHDISGHVSLGKIIEEFNLAELDNFEIIEISAKTGFNLSGAFAKFYTMLTGEKIRKSKFTHALSIFTSGGIPIISQYDSNDHIEKKSIEGGFLVAITQFSSMKMNNDNDEVSFITFESESSGTYVVGKSQHFIGSLLWQKELGVPIERSKSALKDMLEHLENVSDYKNEEQVAFHVEQYITNMM